MVVGAFPIAKLSVLLVKQISKPIANACKERAKNSPFFRTYVCMPPAQFYNWCEVKAKMWILNLGKPVNIPVLSQEMAIELGANLLGETVIFVIGAGLLIIEYNRQSKKEAAKENKREEEMKHITSTITDLYFTVQRQQTQLREMERIIYSISGQKPTQPSSPAAPGNQPPPAPPTAATPQNMNHIRNYEDMPVTYTPYPNKGIILQSLNYIQMDALSSLFPCNGSKRDISEEDKPIQQHRRGPAVLSQALYNIENNFRSLF
ncbi:optic atrophy 3 protein homolog [Galleria mellonella]|uniref:Optic atrophy 3 protein homolog n=1 Tax=Galleria mellonella TaxID=7137 RepID=A0A6J1X3Y1_GALME|nr:optic atrophy 3 protein homolog [Galleria mellonella]